MVKTMKPERKLNKILSAAGILLCALCVLLMNVLPASAAEESGSLTLRCVFSVEGGERVLPNDEYSLVKIADASITPSEVRYTTLTPFLSYDCNWKNQSATGMNEKAKALAAYCERNGYYTDTRTTDANGELTFDHLTVGLYLVARTKVDAVNEDFVTDPLLFFVPQNVNGEAAYQVVASLKFSYLSAEEDRKPSDPTLPQTGQLMWPIGPLATIGCLLILAGVAFRRKGDSGEE